MITPVSKLPFVTFQECYDFSIENRKMVELDPEVYNGLSAEEILSIESFQEFNFFVKSPTFLLDGQYYVVKRVALGTNVREVNANVRAFLARTPNTVFYSASQYLTSSVSEKFHFDLDGFENGKFLITARIAVLQPYDMTIYDKSR